MRHSSRERPEMSCETLCEYDGGHKSNIIERVRKILRIAKTPENEISSEPCEIRLYSKITVSVYSEWVKNL